MDGLAISGLSKAFGSNRVLANVSVTFANGEVHALLGANGAGKSTLLGCISGAVHPDTAAIRLGRHTYDGFTPRKAHDAGIAIIYQQFQLAGSLSIADNIFLGRELKTVDGRIDYQEELRVSGQVLNELGVDLDPRARVEGLSVGEQQMVEIARSVRLDPQVLILDEPTAALGAHEVEALLALVGRLAKRGIAIIYVTHLLAEVLEVADRATVLRDGNILWTKPRDELTLSTLIDAISPQAVIQRKLTHSISSRGRPVAELSAVCGRFAGPADLQIGSGEVVGIVGLLGSGRTDILETIAGVTLPSSGSVVIDGRTADLHSPSSARRSGIALVASDRKAQSLFATMSSLENMLMPHLKAIGNGVRRRRRESKAFRRLADHTGLTPPTPNLAVEQLSGGNAQKVAVARWTSGIEDTRLLLLDEPTQGVDVGARQDLYRLIREWASHNQAAVLFTTSDPEEALALADRVVVLVEGRVVFTGSADIDEERLVALAQPQTTERGAQT